MSSLELQHEKNSDVNKMIFQLQHVSNISQASSKVSVHKDVGNILIWIGDMKHTNTQTNQNSRVLSYSSIITERIQKCGESHWHRIKPQQEVLTKNKENTYTATPITIWSRWKVDQKGNISPRMKQEGRHLSSFDKSHNVQAFTSASVAKGFKKINNADEANKQKRPILSHSLYSFSSIKTMRQCAPEIMNDNVKCNDSSIYAEKDVSRSSMLEPLQHNSSSIFDYYPDMNDYTTLVSFIEHVIDIL